MIIIAKLLSFFALFNILFSIVCISEENPITVAVLEFENNTGKPEFEHLKKGIRDMITTDITQVEDISVVERARVEQIFKEIELSSSVYFDKENSVKIGKMIGANFLLTGSYLLEMSIIRIDVRLVSVNSGEIIYAEKIQGKKDDFFSLEKDLVSAIVEKMKPSVTKRELRKVNQIQTESYAIFDKYSKAVYLEEHGKLMEAVSIMQKATAGDQSFKMAQEKLSLFQKALSARIAEQTEIKAMAENSLKDVMDLDFSESKSVVDIKDHSPAYYMSVLSLAVHYGLRSDFQNERDSLLSFWNEFSNEPEPGKIWFSLQKEVEKKSLFWEKLLMKIDHSNNYMSFSDEAQRLYDYPRFINIWPFCQKFGLILKGQDTSLETRRNNATHKLLPHDFFSNHYETTGDSLDFRCYNQSHPSSRANVLESESVKLNDIAIIDCLKLETSIAVFYIIHSDLKIPKKSFDSVVETIVSLLGDCSPYDSQNTYTKNDVFLLLDRLSLISQYITNKKLKLKVDKFILLITKFLKGEAPGDTSAKGITISKTFFPGENFAIISFLPNLRPITETNYQECLINAIQTFNPNGKFYIATGSKKLSDAFIPATRDNVVKSIDFLKENIYAFQFNDTTLSFDERIIDAYMAAPSTEDTHFIILLEHSLDLASHLILRIPYYYKVFQKKVKLSVILTNGTLEELKEYDKDRKMDKDSLLNLVIFSGGNIYLKDVKISFASKSQAEQWFIEKMNVFSPQILSVNEYDQLQIDWKISNTDHFDHIEIYRNGDYLNPEKFSASEKVYTVKNMKRGKSILIHIVGIRQDCSAVPLKTVLIQVMRPNFPNRIRH